jgi:ribosomal protein S7
MAKKYELRNHNIGGILFNSLIKNGKTRFKELFFKKVCRALKKKHIKTASVLFILREINKLRVPLGLRTKQIAGSKVRIPVPLPVKQQFSFVIRSMLTAARKRHSSNYLTAENFVAELLETKQGQLTNTKKALKDHMRTIVENRAFTRYL